MPPVSHRWTMGRGTSSGIALLAILAASLPAGAAPALPGDLGADLLQAPSGDAASSAASRLPDAAPAAKTLAPPPGTSSLLASLAGALGAAGDALGKAGGALLGLGHALLGGLASLAALVASAALALAGALAGALLGALAHVASTIAQHPDRVARPAAGLGVAWGLTTLQAKVPSPRALLAPLFSRLERHELLRNDARQRMYEFVRERPGAHLSQVHAHMGLGWGATVYHLRKLRDAQLLTARMVGNQLCHFVNGDHRSPQEQQVLAATKTASAQAIVDYLKLRGPTSQRDLARELGMSSALVSWHAKRLEGLGAVARVRSGRTCVLALPAAAVPRAAPAPSASPATPAMTA
jgi:DNA-binding transcriptional ArsR family regulator